MNDYTEVTVQIYGLSKRLNDLLNEEKWEAASILAAVMSGELKELSYWCAGRYKDTQK